MPTTLPNKKRKAGKTIEYWVNPKDKSEYIKYVETYDPVRDETRIDMYVHTKNIELIKDLKEHSDEYGGTWTFGLPAKFSEFINTITAKKL